MKQYAKKILSLTLLIGLLTTIFSTTNVYGSEVMPCSDSIESSSLTTTVNNDGALSITYYIRANTSSTSKIVITTYFEQKYLGLFWQRVHTGSPNDEWVSTIYNYIYSRNRTFTLPEEGTYRTTVIYEVHSTDGSVETKTHQKTTTY